ncbi:MAG: hypothetical protein E7659_06315 [Ruminococcaceae bacterium]|nr:hypothetical protein [Oscillospiraceae bacterium]
MSDQKLNNKAPLLSSMHIALLLLCAVLLSSYAISGLYARYISEETGGDNARVAKFSFEDDLETQYQTFPATFAPNDLHTINITIENKGEVTLHYVVTFENLTGNLPLQLQNGNGISGEIQSNSETTFSWTIEWDQEDISVDQAGKMDVVRIVVAVEQVD